MGVKKQKQQKKLREFTIRFHLRTLMETTVRATDEDEARDMFDTGQYTDAHELDTLDCSLVFLREET